LLTGASGARNAFVPPLSRIDLAGLSFYSESTTIHGMRGAV
jgi:hypothetical protein